MVFAKVCFLQKARYSIFTIFYTQKGKRMPGLLLQLPVGL